MEITNEQIRKFISNECTAEEAVVIAHYLQQHPEVWQQWLDEKEWQQFEQTPLLTEAESRLMLQHIQLHKQGVVKKITPYYSIAAAAVLLMAVVLGVFLYKLPVKDKQLTARVPAATHTVQKDTVFYNHSRKSITLTLDDYSEVTLYPNSRIALQQPFVATERNIRLNGEAVFNVAKDKTRPFTVFTEGFATRALGTVFHITAYEAKPTATIHLREGKVLVTNLKQQKQQQYLLPGQECVFDKALLTLTRVEVAAPDEATAVAKAEKKAPADNANAYVFENMPLPDIAEALSAGYHIPIACTGKLLYKRKFTGRFSKDESLEYILNTIAALNELQVEKSDSAYRILPLP